MSRVSYAAPHVSTEADLPDAHKCNYTFRSRASARTTYKCLICHTDRLGEPDGRVWPPNHLQNTAVYLHTPRARLPFGVSLLMCGASTHRSS